MKRKYPYIGIWIGDFVEGERKLYIRMLILSNDTGIILSTNHQSFTENKGLIINIYEWDYLPEENYKGDYVLSLYR